MRKLIAACFATSLIFAAACGGKKPAPANPDEKMMNSGGSDMGSGSGSASGSGMNPCNGASGGGSGMAPDPCSGAE